MKRVSFLAMVLILGMAFFIPAFGADMETTAGDLNTSMRAGFDSLALMIKDQAGPFIGIGVALQFDEESNQFEIMEVLTNTPAEIAGMQKGDKITTINGKTFLSQEELAKEIRASAVPGRKLKIELIRDNSNMIIESKARVLREDKTYEAQALLERVEKEGTKILQEADLAMDLAIASSSNNEDGKKLISDANEKINNFWEWYLGIRKKVDDLFTFSFP
ncbi:MAG: PDZ domain-containing protein [Candidatus Brennerbacteria bacterium]|nr:PDZ domain-containing protein [Candidatus Brennerbacteria bacterium]